MFRNNILIAWRYIRKDKLLSFISIGGLSISLAVGLLIFRFAVFEMQFDHFNKNENRIYELYSKGYENNRLISQSAFTSVSSGPMIKNKIPGVEQVVRLVNTKSWFDCTVTYDDGKNPVTFNEHHLYYSDPSMFSVFSFPLERGDKNSVLDQPYTAVLSESTSKKYFKNTDPVGKIIHLKGSADEHDYLVTGIMKDIPVNSNIDAEILLSIRSIENKSFVDNYGNYTFLLLEKEAGLQSLENKLNNFISNYQPELNEGTTSYRLGLLPLKEIHLHSFLEDEMKAGGNAATVYFLLLVAAVILAIAWINYINLAATRSVARAREVSIRKISGANYRQLVGQLLSESFIINLISLAVAVVLIYYLAPFFHEITGLPVSFSSLTGILVSFQGLVATFLFFTGIFISGYFPARMIASARAPEILKGKFNNSKNGHTLRRVLVTLQFSAAIILTVSMLTLNRQLRFMQNQKIGADINHMIVIKAPTTFDSLFLKRISVFKTRLEDESIISEVAASASVPGDANAWTGEIKQEKDSYQKGLSFGIYVIDPDFIPTYRLRLLAGRNFVSSDFPLQKFGMKTEPVILNRTAVMQLGYHSPEETIGHNIYWDNNKCEVIGVIDNFHQQSFKKSIQPLLFTVNYGPDLSLRLNGKGRAGLETSISSVRQAWKSFFPFAPFDFFILRDYYSKQYSADRQLMFIIRFFSIMSIFISCMGLFGLSSFTAQQKAREMSIRKILGATFMNRLLLLSREFLFLIAAASFVALPLSWLGMHHWLENFAYRIQLSGWLFILPVVLIISITFLMVSVNSIKTTLMNPVNTLKSE